MFDKLRKIKGLLMGALILLTILTLTFTVQPIRGTLFPILAIAITTLPYNATAAYPGWNVNISVFLLNIGANTETFNVTAYYDEHAIGKQTVQLAQGENTTITFTWNLTGVDPCEYNSTGGYYIPYIISANVSSPTLGEIKSYDGTVTVRRPGDANGDGKIYIGDLSLIGGSWNQAYPSSYYKWQADFNGDGKVYIGDLAILGSNWQKY